MSDPVLRSGLIRLAYANPDLRSALLPLIMKEAKSFDDAVKGKKFKHPETGNDVLFGFLPTEEQTKIRSQWVKKNPRGSGGDGGDPKDMLKEDSDKYFAQHVSGNIGKKSLTDALKGTGFKPRGKGSFDKKRGIVELLLDSEDGRSSPMRAVFSGSDYTKGDGKGYIRIESPYHGHIDDAFDMTGDPDADAKAMHSALKDLAEQMGEYEKERKGSKKKAGATYTGDMAAVLDAEADPTSHDQNLPEHYYFGKTAEERLENIEKMLSRFASPKSKDIGNDAALQMQVYRDFNAKGFGKRAAAGIPVTLKKPTTLKDGTVIEAGTRGTLRFHENNPKLAIIDFDTRPNTKLGVAYLFDYFGRPFMKIPSLASLEKMSDDGVAKSVTGKTVEPDGYGPDGSPSWLLVRGMI